MSTLANEKPVQRPQLPHFLSIRYEVTDLGPAKIPGEPSIFLYARGLNNLGQVVGECTVNNQNIPFIWSKATGRNYLPYNGFGAVAMCINDSGVAAGCYFNNSNWPPSHACLWRNNAIVNLATPGGGGCMIYDINNSDVVVGVMSGHACCSQQGTLVDIGTLGGPTSSALAINNAGTIVGFSEIDNNGTRHGFVCDGVGKPMKDLGDLGGGWSIAVDINDAGQILGYSPPQLGGAVHACLWQAGTIIDIGAIGGINSNGASINNVGTAVGMSNTSINSPDYHAFVYNRPVLGYQGRVEGMLDVNSLLLSPFLSPSGQQNVFDYAFGINDQGQMLASCSAAAQYLLTPVIVLRSKLEMGPMCHEKRD